MFAYKYMKNKNSFKSSNLKCYIYVACKFTGRYDTLFVIMVLFLSFTCCLQLKYKLEDVHYPDETKI